VKPAAFSHVECSTLEAIEALSERGNEVKCWRRGQSLISLMNMCMASPPVSIEVNRIEALTGTAKNSWTIEDRTPVNASEGLIANTRPVGPTGVAKLYEIVTQMRGQAGERQPAKTDIGVTHTRGGSVPEPNGGAPASLSASATGPRFR
jgi:hypothetical protein